jgi:hypothetical protein
VVYIALADGENDLPFDNGMDVSMDSTSLLSGSTSDPDNDNDGKSSNDEDDEDDGVGTGEANINTSASGIPNSGASDIGTSSVGAQNPSTGASAGSTADDWFDVPLSIF